MLSIHNKQKRGSQVCHPGKQLKGLQVRSSCSFDFSEGLLIYNMGLGCVCVCVCVCRWGERVMKKNSREKE